jgi:adenosylmethionine-8-amino-7-oxononanoate aminotransferase
LKLARQYHIQRGNPQKQLAISRWRSYHGATVGALSVTGMPAMRSPFASWLPPFPHIDACYPYRCRFAGCGGTCNLSCARELENAILEPGPENVSAFVAEPISLGGVAGSIPPAGYFSEIREICDRHDVLFIADEIITGFGRTGRYFAIEHWDVVPDLLVFGKGASSGYCPLGGVLVREQIRQSFAEADDHFRHIFTYVDNPVAARAGSVVLDIIEEEGILEHVRQVSTHLEAAARQRLEPHPTVGEVRCIGLIRGVEFVKDKSTKQPFPASVQFHKKLSEYLMESGLSVGATGGGADFTEGDDLRLYPPLIVTEAQIDEALSIIEEGLTRLETELAV